MSNQGSFQKAQKRNHRPLITLTTDFGLQDYFVGSLKGVILSQVPEAQIIDITHEIRRHDVVSAAFIVKETIKNFPQGTIHLIVIDPGVGTTRRNLIVVKEGQFFVAPDNGVLSYIYQEAGSLAFEVLDTEILRLKRSPTFAGRDHFAPIAALLAGGRPPEGLGREISDYLLMHELFPERSGQDLAGKIVYFDHFGNAITNLNDQVIQNRDDFKLELRGHILRGLKGNYSEGEREGGNLIMNSSGQLEIFVPFGNAKESLGLNLLDDLLIRHFYRN
ncbi:MAG: S-adenosyl-l-methionine hydroxide adenosyltransferase family protein [Nitrospiria bacterium]